MASLVQKTYFHSASGTANPVISLTTTSTANNWLIVGLFADAPRLWTLVTDQGESFSLIGIFTGGASFGCVFWLLQSTKSCSSITFTKTSGGSNNIYHCSIFEVHGTNLQYVNQGGINGGGSSSIHAFEKATTGTSVQLVSMMGPSSGSTIYFAGCGSNPAFPPAAYSVTAGWTIDQLTALLDYQIGTAYLSSSGTQQPTFSWTAGSTLLDSSGIFIQDSASVTLTPTSTSMTSTLDPSTSGQLVTFKATVIGPGGPGLPTGFVTFNIDGANVATTPLSTIGIAQAQYSTSSLSVGNHSVYGIYPGDSNYLPSTSPAIVQIVICTNKWKIGLQYDPNWNKINWSQPGGAFTPVLPGPVNGPFLNYPVAGQFFVELTGLWTAGCGHWFDAPLIVQDFDCPSGSTIALVCCPVCSYIQYTISPFIEAVNADPQFGVPYVII